MEKITTLDGRKLVDRQCEMGNNSNQNKNSNIKFRNIIIPIERRAHRTA